VLPARHKVVLVGELVQPEAAIEVTASSAITA
jgi:hypothetical protein